MKYTVKTPAISGDIVPLATVAECMARAKTVAFGAAPFHKKKFDHFFREYAKLLVEEAQAGSLLVCSHLGKAIDAANIIDDPEVFGEPTVMKMDGKRDENDLPVEPDWELTHLLGLHVALCSLNEWGKATGSTYVVSHEQAVWLEGWHDDQGNLTVMAHWQPAQQSQLEGQENGATNENSERHPQLDVHQGKTNHGVFSQEPQHSAQEHTSPKGIEIKRRWDDHAWRELYYRALEPGMTKQRLAEQYKMSRQGITKQLNKAKRKFAPRAAGPFDAVLHRK